MIESFSKLQSFHAPKAREHKLFKFEEIDLDGNTLKTPLERIWDKGITSVKGIKHFFQLDGL